MIKVSEGPRDEPEGRLGCNLCPLWREGYSPVIAEGEADVIVSFEKIEAARHLPCLKKGGKIIVNTQEIDPMPVITGAAQYPTDIIEEMKAKGVFVDAVDALALAEQAGNSKSVNIVLMGKIAKYFDIPYEKWIAAIEKMLSHNLLR